MPLIAIKAEIPVADKSDKKNHPNKPIIGRARGYKNKIGTLFLKVVKRKREPNKRGHICESLPLVPKFTHGNKEKIIKRDAITSIKLN
tara:strand:+ start:1461 stop:1724 length:264 start_codon:yes stop_codon:yes gene_type:complete